MIAALTVWVKNIILVVLFASFMELLLPNTSMKKFIRVIMGVFIMLAILNPILLLLKTENTDEHIAVMGAREANKDCQTNTINQLVERTVTNREELLAAAYNQDLSKQISAVVKSVGGIEDAKAQVSISENGKISKIIIYVKPGDVTNKAIKVDTIMLGKTETSAIQPGLTEKVKKVISELYQVPFQNIELHSLS